MNPFLVRETLPDFYAIKSKHVIPAIDNVIKDNTEVISQIESMSETTSVLSLITLSTAGITCLDFIA